jgi:hypothetical protein
MLNKPRFRQVLRDAIWAVALIVAILFVFRLDRSAEPKPQASPGNLLTNSAFQKAPSRLPTRPPIPASASPKIVKLETPPKAAQKPAPPVAVAKRPAPLFDFAAKPTARKTEKKVEFFSVKAKAQSVVFVVDCSGSMTGGRFERARLELALSILRLQPNQQFFVVFFNNAAIPMFNKSLPANLEMASTAMKYKVTQWMLGISPDGGTEPEEAMQIAAGLKPDVIYLLSDGEFAPLGPSLQQTLRRQKTVVNALAFEDPEGAKLLADIAAQTAGTYRFVPAGDVPAISLADLACLLTDQLIGELHDPNVDTRRQAHSALVEMAQGKDLGPTHFTDDRDLEKATERWIQWGRNRLLPLYTRADDDSIVAHLQNPGRITRWAAASVAAQRHLDAPRELIESLKGADRETSQVIRRALTHLSKGVDFGPAEDATNDERSRAVGRWSKWLESHDLIRVLAAKSRESLLDALKSTNPAERWAAVMAVRQRKIEAPRELLEVLRDPDQEVRTEARGALVSIAARTDLGPHLPEHPGRYIPDELLEFLNDSNADRRDESRQALAQLSGSSQPADWDGASRRVSPDAIARWKTWWTAKKEKRAQTQLRQAKQLREAGRSDAADKWLKTIVDTLPGTLSADEARRLLVR